MRAVPYGEGGLFVDLEAPEEGRGARTLAAARALAHALPHADVVAGAGSLAAFGVGTFDDADAAIDAAARATPSDLGAPARRHVVPVVYDGEDLSAVADEIGATPRELIALHGSVDAVAEIIGFLPGFAYLSGLPRELWVPRRASPRPRVPSGSVAVAGGWGGIYPSTSPGGWRLLGRTSARMFDVSRAEPALLALGDRVRFVEVDGQPTADAHAAAPTPAASRDLVVTKVAALVTVQDGGRAGRQSTGVPPGGAWDPTALAAANLAVGNAPGAAALEIAGGSLEVLVTRSLTVSLDGGAPLQLAPGETLRVPSCERFVRVLALSGGIACPAVLGSRGSSPSVGLGARPLARGDTLALSRDVGPPRVGPSVEPPRLPATLHVDPGPHFWRFSDDARRALLDTTWLRSPRGDRVGVRLDGPPLDTNLTNPTFPVPMTRGAIEVPPDGSPIVLGPDHPTTGGYPVIAVLRRASQGVFARVRPGEPVRLVLA